MTNIYSYKVKNHVFIANFCLQVNFSCSNLHIHTMYHLFWLTHKQRWRFHVKMYYNLGHMEWTALSERESSCLSTTSAHVQFQFRMPVELMDCKMELGINCFHEGVKIGNLFRHCYRIFDKLYLTVEGLQKDRFCVCS